MFFVLVPLLLIGTGGRLGITATYEGNEVRAEGQEIAGKVASSMQFTTQRTLEDPDAIGFVAMFTGNS